MIYLALLWAFLKVGSFSFGGAYGAIPLIRDVVLASGWLTEEMFAYFVAVSESTPGPIMVNLATYIGSTQAGFFGAVVATCGVVLPSFLIILMVFFLLKNLVKNQYIQAILQGIKPCFIGIVMATGIYMVVGNVIGVSTSAAVDTKSLLITALLLALPVGYRKLKKKDLSPIALIILAAGLGMVVYAI